MDPRTATGIALLLTRGRPTTNLPRFFRAAKVTGMTIPGAVIVDADDYAEHNETYDALELPDNWTVHVVRGGSCADATNEAFNDLFTENMQYLFWLADDLIPETPGWDVKVIETLNGWNIVSTDDGRDAPNKFNGATAWSGDLVRAVGYIYAPGLKHFYIDTMWEELGKLMNNWTVRMDVMVRHAHHSWSDVPKDATVAHTQSFWNFDEPAFMDWKNNERLPAANRIGELMLQYGVTELLPDLSHIRLMIATPCGSGKYDRQYMTSLYGTFEILRQCKAQVNFAELPFCSDISLARAKIFGIFLRSNSTHLLSIDDDMGWKPQDVVKLFAYNRDFVAVAGPRKVSPPSFAVQNAGRNGQPQPLMQEATTGLIEVSDVGMAFALITRKCAERVRDAHAELMFAGDDGRMEYAVFNPIVVNRRYRSEDFAFCHRWRGLGGKIFVDPNVALAHVGAFVWHGDWMNHLVTEAQQKQQIAA